MWKNTSGTTREEQSNAHQIALVVRTLLPGPHPFPLSAPFSQRARTRFRHSRQWLRVRMAGRGAAAQGWWVTGAAARSGLAGLRVRRRGEEWRGYGCGWREGCAGSQPTPPPHHLSNAKPLFQHTQREYPVYAQRELLDFPMRELLGTVYSLKLKQHHSRAEVAPCSTTRRDGAKPRSDES